MRSIWAPLKDRSETGFENFLKGEKDWKCSSKMVSYCCDIAETKDVSSTRYGADRCHPCVRLTISVEDMVQGRKSPKCILWVTTETGRKVRGLKELERMVR